MKKKINYKDNINIHGCARFEQYTASHLIENYVTKHDTKGCLNFDNWNVLFQSIIKYYTESGNCDKTIRSIYTKKMYEIMKLESKTQNKCVFLLF